MPIIRSTLGGLGNSVLPLEVVLCFCVSALSSCAWPWVSPWPVCCCFHGSLCKNIVGLSSVISVKLYLPSQEGVLYKFIVFKYSGYFHIFVSGSSLTECAEGRKTPLWLDGFLASGFLVKSKPNTFSARMKEKIPLVFDWRGIPWN